MSESEQETVGLKCRVERRHRVSQAESQSPHTPLASLIYIALHTHTHARMLLLSLHISQARTEAHAHTHDNETSTSTSRNIAKFACSLPRAFH